MVTTFRSIVNLVLYSRRCGWWKIADFGIHDMANGYARKNPGYSAPDLLRKISFTNNVDTWSLGCILFELCIGRKTFRSDREVMELGSEDAGWNLPFEQPQWLNNQQISATFNSWITEMLDLDYERRPEAKGFGERFPELLQHLITKPATNESNETTNETANERRHGATNERVTIWDHFRKDEFLKPKYLLGTDVPPRYQGTLRFEKVVAQGVTRKEQSTLLLRANEIACAREALLGQEHTFTLWSKTLHAWARLLILGAVSSSREATTELFRELLELKGRVLGEKHPETVAIRVGLAWSLECEYPETAIDLFAESYEVQRQCESLGPYHPDTLSSKVGLARAFLIQMENLSISVWEEVELLSNTAN